MSQRRIGFVVPRYGEDVLGGAETLARGLAEQLTSRRLADIEVLTTCVRDHLTWENELPAGESRVNDVSVRRFPMVQTCGDLTRYHALNLRLIRGEILRQDEQYEWVDGNPHSPALYGYIEGHAHEFDLLFFIPYLFGTTYYGSAIYPSRSILWPCLHNESYAYLSPTRDVYCGCLGVMFNSDPERLLARRLYGPHAGAQVVGFGIDPFQADAERFRTKYRLSAPFILYSGRLEGAKNVPLLVDHFLEYVRRRGRVVKLVLMGSGPEAGPKHKDIIRIGFKTGQEKLDAYAAAAVLCQPSVNESFSIVIMESWLCAVPVLVHADSEVTRHHVVQSNGGLYFRSYDEFESALDLFLGEDDLRRRMGMNGHAYVRDQYNWNAVLGRFEKAMEHWLAARPT